MSVQYVCEWVYVSVCESVRVRGERQWVSGGVWRERVCVSLSHQSSVISHLKPLTSFNFSTETCHSLSVMRLTCSHTHTLTDSQQQTHSHTLITVCLTYNTTCLTCKSRFILECINLSQLVFLIQPKQIFFFASSWLLHFLPRLFTTCKSIFLDLPLQSLLHSFVSIFVFHISSY